MIKSQRGVLLVMNLVYAVYTNYINLMQESKDQMPDFIQKLMRMMKDYSDLINWGNQGEELVIYNQKQFQQQVLHRFFRHGKLQSFVRQLNMYGFHKVCRNKNSINFRNKFFFQGNQANFHLIKRRKKDCEEEEQPVNRMEENFVRVINQRHGDQFPELPTIIQQILQFKARNTKTMQKLRKSLDVLGRQLNERKSKTLKPTIIEIKEMISSIEDSSKKTEMSMEQMIQLSDNNTNLVKKEESESFREENNMHQNLQQMQQIITHPMNTQMSYPALHGAGGYFGTVFHPATALQVVSSLCSFNSVTNFIN